MPNRTKIISYLISFSFLTLSFRHEITSICLYLSGIISLIEIIKKKINIIKIKKNTIVIFFISYILIEIIGLFYTENLYFGLKDIESKLLLIIGSLIILANNQNDLKTLNFFKYYIFGITINLIYIFIIAILHYNKTKLFPKYEEFSIFMHPTYLSACLVFAIIIVFENKKLIINNVFLRVGLFIFYSIGILATDSKAGILCYIIILFYYTVKYILTFNFKLKITFFILSIIISFFVFEQLSKSRFTELFGNLQTSTKFNNYVGFYNSTESRIIIWRCTTEVIKDHLILGTGTGDIKDELLKQYSKTNFVVGLGMEYNCHNQFLQILGTFGIALGSLIIFIFLNIFYNTILQKNIFYCLITIVFIINFLFESFLETKAGMELFILLNMYFSLSNFESKKKL